MIKMKKNIINIPNILSFYRLISFPVVLYFALKHMEQIFVILIVIDLITDVLDGFIARRFNMQTEFGARLDSIADIGMFTLAVIGIFVFKMDDIRPHITIFYIFLGLYVLSNIVSLIKFGRSPSLHLYSWKIGGYIQGIFLFVLFVKGFNVYLYYFAMIWGILSFIEHITIQLIIKKMISNAKGLYWVIKNRKMKVSE